LERIQGLREYVHSEDYRKALNLPKVVTEEYVLLAQGEYNINYLFTHPITKQKLLLRVNCGSQMHLEHQIEYEAHALKLLQSSKRTPKVFYVDGSKKLLNHGILVMEYLPGRVLDYKTDLTRAAKCLADIHSVKLEESSGLLEPKNPLQAILEECEQMFQVYEESPLGKSKTKAQIRNMLNHGWTKVGEMQETYHCCINTELNSTNFLIGKDGDYLIDWEKPLYGDPAQDLGHFLAPTTTFWKTDTILNLKEMEDFIDEYIKVVNGRFSTIGLKERVYIYIPITCLRGITWCAMAWVQYQEPDKLIFNESTFQKLEAYLSDEFLGAIEENLLQ
jgi:aminoglycoside phosphotransferase (APT) family kinase protein